MCGSSYLFGSGKLLDQPGFELLEHTENRLSSNALVPLAAVKLNRAFVGFEPHTELILRLTLKKPHPAPPT
jgi:hypothetical protein